jgi:hypothetical protein
MQIQELVKTVEATTDYSTYRIEIFYLEDHYEAVVLLLQSLDDQIKDKNILQNPPYTFRLYGKHKFAEKIAGDSIEDVMNKALATIKE